MIAQGYTKSLSIATVYRNIHSLIEEGWLESVEMPGQVTRYEVAGKAHHHHFLCRSCGGVYELDGCPAPKEISLPPGFTATGHEFFVFGKCSACPISEVRQLPRTVVVDKQRNHRMAMIDPLEESNE